MMARSALRNLAAPVRRSVSPPVALSPGYSPASSSFATITPASISGDTLPPPRSLPSCRLLSTSAGAKTYTTSLRCTCGFCTPSGSAGTPVFKCPQASALPNMDHVIMPVDPPSSELKSLAAMASSPTPASCDSPFVRFRSLLYPYRVAMSLGMSDQSYVDLVVDLDSKIAAVGGTASAPRPAPTTRP